MDKVRKLNIQSIQAQSTSSCCLSVPLGAVLFLDLGYQAFLLLIAIYIPSLVLVLNLVLVSPT